MQRWYSSLSISTFMVQIGPLILKFLAMPLIMYTLGERHGEQICISHLYTEDRLQILVEKQSVNYFWVFREGRWAGQHTQLHQHSSYQDLNQSNDTSWYEPSWMDDYSTLHTLLVSSRIRTMRSSPSTRSRVFRLFPVNLHVQWFLMTWRIHFQGQEIQPLATHNFVYTLCTYKSQTRYLLLSEMCEQKISTWPSSFPKVDSHGIGYPLSYVARVLEGFSDIFLVLLNEPEFDLDQAPKPSSYLLTISLTLPSESDPFHLC